MIEAIKAADPLVDFSQYAIDGVVPNLFVVHAGHGRGVELRPRTSSGRTAGT